MYPVASEWKTGNTVDLNEIYSKLPKFITEMKGPTSREEIECVLNSHDPLYPDSEFNPSKLTPRINEIIRKKKGIGPQEKPSFRANDERLKAFSLQTSRSDCYLDCEYMLNMWLPEHSFPWFKIEEGNRIRKIEDEKQKLRWIFTPSYRRAKIALLDWPKDDIVTQDTTIRILVVRPSEFDDYVKYCGHKFPVIRLPQDEIGAGYPRLWIQKIALRLKLKFIWMIDDSVEYFYVYDLDKETKNNKERRLQFGQVLKRIENSVMNDAKDKDRPIEAMSPAMGGTPVQSAIAVFLNLKVLESKDVFYRPELPTYEDAIFRYECEQNGLEVVTDNRVYLHDHQWHDTGAGSPYVQDNPTTAAASRGRGKSVRGK